MTMGNEPTERNDGPTTGDVQWTMSSGILDLVTIYRT